jgi:predicted lipid carrier protein YhbT
MKGEVFDIILKKENFPCMLRKSEGQTLKKFFDLDQNFLKKRSERNHIDDLEFRYIYNENNEKYILIEEYIFKENESVLNIENAIGVNYYLNKNSEN